MTYQEYLRKPGAKEVGPGIVQLTATQFVVDIAQMAPAYLNAIGEKLSVNAMEVVRALAQRDMANLAGEANRVDVKYLKSEASKAFQDKNLQQDGPAFSMTRLAEAKKKLDAGRIRKRQQAAGKIEV